MSTTVGRRGVVLCGGRSRRMGRDKAWLPFGRERLLQRAVRVVGEAVDAVTVVARPGQELPVLPGDVDVLRDDVPDQGPLGGLVPALRAAGDAPCFVTSCDAPLLRPEVPALLFDALGDADVAVAEAEGYTHPLCAVYRPRVRDRIETMMAEGRLRPVFLYEEVPTVRVGEDALRAVDPDLDCLRNVNDADAYEAALARAFPEVRIELYDLARARAATAFVSVRADTLGGALLALADDHPALVPEVLSADGGLAPHWRASLGGERFVDDPAAPLPPDTPILLLSALAGG
jgi:molybdopterin-guanine dinucleotide biosynthesis protein A